MERILLEIQRCGSIYDVKSNVNVSEERIKEHFLLKRSSMQNRNVSGQLVQSLNSHFFPPHIGAGLGRAKRESRITCMYMLRMPPFFYPILVPRGRAPFGQHQESRPLASSSEIPALIGFVNTIE